MRVEIKITAGPAKGQQFTFDEPDRFLFGRATDARISLPKDPYVSRHHFLLEISPPACKISDLESKNGLFVNGVRYGGRKPPAQGVVQAPHGAQDTYLKDGDEIVVGQTRMKVSIQADIFCAKCGKTLFLQREDEYVCVGSVYLCNNCSNKKRIKKSFQKKITTSSYTVEPRTRQVRCIRCQRDVTTEAGVRGQRTHAEYVCKTCREKEAANPLEILEEMLNEAIIQKAPAGSPAIRGYSIEKEIARGGMGMVYKAKNMQNDKFVAIKTMLPHVAINPSSVRTFQREIEVTRQLDHPNIVKLLDHGSAQGTFYLILEFIEGTDLYQLANSKGGALSFEETLPILLETLDGLAYAHQANVTFKIAEKESRTFFGIVHRDLKPQNILLAHNGEQWVPKISDFGTAKSFESAGLTDITVPGDVLGTPMYWPREQITHYKYLNPATDVFSIAAVFYEVLTGSWVREGFEEIFDKCRQNKRSPSISDYMKVIASNPCIPIRERDPHIPEPVARVFDRALRETEVPHETTKMRSVLTELRYPAAGAFRDALVRALEEAGFGKERVSEVPPVKAEIRPPSQEEMQSSEVKDLKDSLPGSIMYSIMQPSSSRKVALLVFDLEHSSEYLHEVGDTIFSNVIGDIYRHVKGHPLSSDLIFMKTTGDGFLGVFHTVNAAFSIALEFLKMPIHEDISCRTALHWGTVKTAPDGDVLGVEVHRVFRVEGIGDEDLVESGTNRERLPDSDRMLITKEAINQLDDLNRVKFRFAGKYRLRGFEEQAELWVLTK